MFRAAERARLVVICAPAGFGKTTVMAEWRGRLKEQGIATGWLTLDEGDDDVSRFLVHLRAAMGAIDPACGTSSQEEYSAEKPAAGMLMDLLECVASQEAPFALFLDDYETIRNPEVHKALRRVLRVVPPAGRIIVGTRREPELGLARLRAHGLLTEIGPPELRFRRDETQEFFLDKHGLDLEPEDLDRLQRCTEGWAVGLQLAALALGASPDPKAILQSFSGSFADVADYLAEDVLARQPESVREFLLVTSVLDRLCGPLCDALTGRSDGYEMLEQLEKANLFLLPLDAEKRWYRYHNAFGQFLRARLERGFRGRVARLHIAAAEWFERAGQPVEAIGHLLQAGEEERAAALMAECARDLVERFGQSGTVIGWVERLPADVVDRYPRLRFAYASALSLRHRYEEACGVLDRLRTSKVAQRAAPEELDEINAVRAMALVFADRVQESHRAAQEGFENLAPQSTFAHGLIGNVFAYHLVATNQFDRAEALVTAARRSNLRIRSDFAAVYSLCIEGVLRLAQGRLGEAIATYRRALELSRELVSGYSVPGALAAALLAEALYERDELDEAGDLISAHLPLLRESGLLDAILIGYITLARVVEYKGDPARADRILAEVEQIGRDRGMLRLVAVVNRERARLFLARGDLTRAGEAAERAERRHIWEPFVGRCMPASDPETGAISQIRLLLRRGNAAEALARIRHELPRAESSGRFRQVLKLLCLQALALAATGQHREALRALREGLRRGAEEGYVRTFADEGQPLAALLQELRPSLEEGGAAAPSGLPREYVDRILVAMRVALGSSGERTAPDEQAPLEPLSERELSVLELLALGLSNKEMADRLCVSESTVRFHLRNIYPKLHAKNRTQAILKGRRYGLIP